MPLPTMKLFLFDLDGTLLNTGGVGLRALERAFAELFEATGIVQAINFGGKTDRAIFRELLNRHHGSNPADDLIDTLASRYLHHLGIEADAIASEMVLPGVRQLLSLLARRDDALVALGTGNLEEGARLKLARTGLLPYFACGGYGSDAEERSEVLLTGRRRAESLTGRTIASRDVFVIGDTPLDIAAARKAGFQAVAIATGRPTVADLAAERPDFLFRDMLEMAEAGVFVAGAVNA